jgi:hypothetical protein
MLLRIRVPLLVGRPAFTNFRMSFITIERGFNSSHKDLIPRLIPCDMERCLQGLGLFYARKVAEFRHIR